MSRWTCTVPTSVCVHCNNKRDVVDIVVHHIAMCFIGSTQQSLQRRIRAAPLEREIRARGPSLHRVLLGKSLLSVMFGTRLLSFRLGARLPRSIPPRIVYVPRLFDLTEVGLVDELGDGDFRDRLVGHLDGRLHDKGYHFAGLHDQGHRRLAILRDDQQTRLMRRLLDLRGGRCVRHFHSLFGAGAALHNLLLDNRRRHGVL